MRIPIFSKNSIIHFLTEKEKNRMEIHWAEGKGGGAKEEERRRRKKKEGGRGREREGGRDERGERKKEKN